jgi:hypothetical protein
MYYPPDPRFWPKCSQCGSQHSERFEDDFYSGTRCKNCGHESKKRHAWLDPDQPPGTAIRLRADQEPPTF